jgi:hypothetical protein
VPGDGVECLQHCQVLNACRGEAFDQSPPRPTVRGFQTDSGQVLTSLIRE